MCHIGGTALCTATKSYAKNMRAILKLLRPTTNTIGSFRKKKENSSHPIGGQISKRALLFICFTTHSYIVWVNHGEIK